MTHSLSNSQQSFDLDALRSVPDNQIKHFVGEIDLQTVMLDIEQEVSKAQAAWPPFNSAHEEYAVLLEEVEELWDHVKINQKRRDIEAMRSKAIQVAAMAVRFVLNICNENSGRK